jgi:hypothetical protein
MPDEPEDDRAWRDIARGQFEAAYAPEDSIYDALNAVSATDQDSRLPPSHPLALDTDAAGLSDSVPAFLARPAGAPAYHGFRVMTDVVVDGFTLGTITDFEVEEAAEGDAFVIAPDDSRAGLVWEISEAGQFDRVCVDTEDRWGVWAVSFPFPMNSRENARLNLAAVLPFLKPHWIAWRRSR